MRLQIDFQQRQSGILFWLSKIISTIFDNVCGPIGIGTVKRNGQIGQRTKRCLDEEKNGRTIFGQNDYMTKRGTCESVMGHNGYWTRQQADETVNVLIGKRTNGQADILMYVQNEVRMKGV